MRFCLVSAGRKGEAEMWCVVIWLQGVDLDTLLRKIMGFVT